MFLIIQFTCFLAVKVFKPICNNKRFSLKKILSDSSNAVVKTDGRFIKILTTRAAYEYQNVYDQRYASNYAPNNWYSTTQPSIFAFLNPTRSYQNYQQEVYPYNGQNYPGYNQIPYGNGINYYQTTPGFPFNLFPTTTTTTPAPFPFNLFQASPTEPPLPFPLNFLIPTTQRPFPFNLLGWEQSGQVYKHNI